MAVVKLYQFGYAFSDYELRNIPDHFKKIDILKKYNYYYDSEIDLYSLERKNCFIIVNGHFVYVDANQVLPEDEVMNRLLDVYFENYEAFLSMIDHMAGRYVIIIGDTRHVNVYPDAINTRSTYFATDRNIMASHVNLIAENGSYEKVELYDEVPRLNNILLHTPYENIKSLIPNHTLDFNLKTLTRFFPRKNNRYKLMDNEEKLKLIEVFWKKQLDQYFKKYDDFVLSLSGGNDSRVTLAMVKEHMDDIAFFTFGTSVEEIDQSDRSARIYEKDKLIVQQMLENIDLDHTFYYFDDDPKTIDQDDLDILERNSLHTLTQKTLPYLQSFFRSKNMMHIRTNLLELARAKFLQPYQNNELNASRKRFKKTFHKYVNDSNESHFNHLFDAFVTETNFGVGIYDYHILDIHYWEIYIGRWYAEVLNSQDSIYNTISPFNHRAMIDVSLSFSYKQRVDNFLSRELINRNYPMLNFYGINNIKNLYEQNKEENSEKNLIFDEFYTYNPKTRIKVTKKNAQNSFFLEKDELYKSAYAETSLYFDKEYGIAEIDLLNQYSSTKHKNYMRYEVYVNDNLMLYEDVSAWQLANNIVLTNLAQGDVIRIRVRALRDVATKAWEKASRISVRKFNTVKKEDEFDRRVYCNSPFSSILGN
ncbi:hypothetical protein [Salinicoccus bachuensis]|uniref:Asparagine synthase (Glutamine-hydrolysing) n=1 Tax=Salinicoccus bachuensis TaxID=3136731 RepID=A0ABZ3CJR0_9STAP